MAQLVLPSPPAAARVRVRLEVQEGQESAVRLALDWAGAGAPSRGAAATPQLGAGDERAGPSSPTSPSAAACAAAAHTLTVPSAPAAAAPTCAPLAAPPLLPAPALPAAAVSALPLDYNTAVVLAASCMLSAEHCSNSRAMSAQVGSATPHRRRAVLLPRRSRPPSAPPSRCPADALALLLDLHSRLFHPPAGGAARGGGDGRAPLPLHPLLLQVGGARRPTPRGLLRPLGVPQTSPHATPTAGGASAQIATTRWWMRSRHSSSRRMQGSSSTAPHHPALRGLVSGLPRRQQQEQPPSQTPCALCWTAC